MWRISLLLLLVLPASACTVLVRGVDNGVDGKAWKRGQVVAVYDDKPSYGAKEVKPEFYLLRFPGVPKEVLASRWTRLNVDENGEMIRRREFRFRLADLPQAARDKLQARGQLVIRVPAYWGLQSQFTESDYTWAQVRDYLRNDRTNTDGDDV